MTSTKKITKSAILKKANRSRKPVRSLTQLAREFGVNTEFTRSNGTVGHAAPGSFRNRVRAEVGKKVYNKIRNASYVR